jgi:predicted dehydrogenase
MTKIGIGVIGMGWMGQTHSRSYTLIKDRFFDSGIEPHLVICADNVEARAREAAERFGFVRMTTDWHDVVNDPDVQAISVTGPNGMHLEANRAIAAAGKHILCEKPVGRFPDETLDSYRAAKDAGVKTLVGYNYRWAPLVQYAAQLIRAGELGTITHYHGRFLNGYAGNPNGFLSWRFLGEQGLGTLGDLMSHAIDMALMLNGPVTRLVSNRETFIRERPIPRPGVGSHYDVASGDEEKGAVTNEDYVSALVHFENGSHGILEACRVINGSKCDMSFEIHGTKGALKWNFETMNEMQFQRRRDDNPAEDGYTTLRSGPAHPFHHHFNPGWAVSLGYDDLKVIEAFKFLESIASGVQAEPGFEAAAKVARVQQAIMLSWESGQWEWVKGIDDDV